MNIYIEKASPKVAVTSPKISQRKKLMEKIKQ